MDERKILRQQFVADDRGDLGLVMGGEAADGVFDIGRAHVVGRRIDQVTGEIDAGDLALDIGSVGILRDQRRGSVMRSER